MRQSIPFKQIAAMRDKLIHHYFGVVIEVVWDTVTDDIPPLIEQLRRLIDGVVVEPKA